MQSFSANAKAEICREVPQQTCCAVAECFGIALFCNSFHADDLKIVTESADFGKILPKLFRRAFGISFDSCPAPEQTGKLVFRVQKPEKIAQIMDAFGFSRTETLSVHLNLPVVEESCCKAAFLRGAFLAGGSVTDPEKGYHLELTTGHQAAARQCASLIQESVGITPKLASRAGGQVVYLKQSELISDYLTYLGAPVAAMGIMEARLEKELNNKVNRCVNCDEANTSKVVEAAQEQIAAIRALEKAGVLETVGEKLLQAAKARSEHPEAALSELAGLMTPPISKPAMNHRLKRLVEMAKEIQQ